MKKAAFVFLIIAPFVFFKFSKDISDSAELYPNLSPADINARSRFLLDSHFNNLSMEIDDILSKRFGKYTPGAAVAVIREGRVIHKKGYGRANLRTKENIDTNTKFMLASVTKQFTAMAVMMLAEEGKLSYDDNLTQYFSGIPHFWKDITIEHLLTHSSGLPDRFYFIGYGEGLTNEDILDRLIEHRLLYFLPGRRHKYSNSGYNLLAMIIEKVSGKKFSEFLKERIFVPLGMNNTIVYDETQPEIEHRAVSYKRTGRRYRPNDFLLYTTGASGIFSSIEDMIKWDQSLYTEELVNKKSLEKAFSPHIKVDWREHYGYGWRIIEGENSKVVYHTGTLGGASNIIFRIPKEEFSIIILSNAGINCRKWLVRNISRLFDPDMISNINF